MNETTRKISYYRNDTTCKLDTPHRIGETEDGRPLYQFVEGWTPVDSEGREVPCECDEDGNWTPLETATIESVAAALEVHYRSLGRADMIPSDGFFGWVAAAWPDDPNLDSWVSAWEAQLETTRDHFEA